ncbi:MAG: hypothetical protein OXR62_14935 [Ahrensia sp.]|nr:hypothetical protein [Ahrensia sp.]
MSRFSRVEVALRIRYAHATVLGRLFFGQVEQYRVKLPTGSMIKRTKYEGLE